MLPLSPFQSKPPSSPPKPSSSSSSNNSSKNPIKPFSIVSVFETGSTSSSSPPIISENPSSPSSSRNPTSKQPSITTISSLSSPGTTNNHQNAAEVYVLDNIIIPDHDDNHLNYPRADVDVNVLLDHIDLELVPDILPPDPDDHGRLPHFNLLCIERQKLKDKKKVEKRRELATAKAFERKSLKEIEEFNHKQYQEENPHLFDGASDDEDDDDRPVPATRCNKCTRSFTKIEGRRGHQTVHKGFDFECREEVCGSIFSTEKREALHHEKHHKN